MRVNCVLPIALDADECPYRRSPVQGAGPTRQQRFGSAPLLQLQLYDLHMQKPPCPFCASLDVELTYEHWLPENWGSYFNVPTLRINSLLGEGIAEVRERYDSPFTTKFGGICSRCNNNWLREIDERAKANYLDLALGISDRLPGRDRLPFAASVYRAALVHAWGNRGRHPLGPVDRMPEFYRTRRPGDHDYIFVGLASDLWIFLGGRQSVTTRTERDAGVLSVFGWGTERLFVLVLVSHRGAEKVADLYAKLVKREARGALKQVWPASSKRAVELSGPLVSRQIAERVTQQNALLLGGEVRLTPRETPRSAKKWEEHGADRYLKLAVRTWPET